MQISVSFE